MYAEEIVFLIMAFLLLMLFMQYGMRKLLGVDASTKAVFESDGRHVNDVHRYINKLLAIILISVILVNNFYITIEHWGLIVVGVVVLFRVVDIVMNWIFQPEEKLHWIMLINSFVIVGFVYLLIELVSRGS
ncbi:DUF4181 domain-containing protein [Alkalibacillus haloalkaliphilus]|uniref:DUF4181 domain-containing protein n=1 Tax=Alkalibacillus haloalkaliphilus TaxID=94136 RepID=A0A511W7J1_9BACI|nr:DUF4181 domain-containing protein [Alkalibacillus haloalkaliphilus]GEN46288.1 hypothetical protein AHA02nite_20640 [Alkalibacillus haloalkaliphilus]